MSGEITPRHAGERVAAGRSPQDQRDYERNAVAQHYEHDAEIFKLVLDQRLAYATAVFVSPEESLDAAQERKFARLAAKLEKTVVHPDLIDAHGLLPHTCDGGLSGRARPGKSRREPEILSAQYPKIRRHLTDLPAAATCPP